MEFSKHCGYAKVVVNENAPYARSGLSEIRGLKEGDCLYGKFVCSSEQYKSGELQGVPFEFKWNGQDAVLYCGENCKYIRKFPRRGLINLKQPNT